MGGSDTLASYVPRLVREWLQSGAPDDLHRRIDGSMVFVDISGFTSLSERMARLGRAGAEGVTDVIAECFNRLLADAYSHDGTLLKFGGDALLLFFRGDDHAHRAAAAALDMRRTLREIRVFQTEAGRVELGMTVGVHTDGFDFFLVGGSHRELIITGPAASTLERVEGSASKGNILVSDACSAHLPRKNIGAPRGGGRLLHGRIATTRGDVAFLPADRDLAPFVPAAMSRAMQGHGGLESEHRLVTVAFLHFQGLDRRIEEGDVDGVAADLEELVRIVQEAVDGRGLCFLGTDIAGDGGKIILTAGAPSSGGNDEEAMLLAVREILDAQPAIAVRVGVNAGPVFAGEIGTRHRKNYTVMGDAVNLAARVMGKSSPGEVLATLPVLDRSRTLFSTNVLEPFMVKGKRDTVTAASVGAARGARAAVASTELALTGRDRELQLLRTAGDRARRGHGGSVQITADPGTGKSRLLHEFLADSEGFVVYRAECRLYQADTAYFSVAHLLDAVLGFGGLDSAEKAERLRAVVEDRIPTLLPWLSLVASALRIDIEASREVRQLDDEFRKPRREAAVIDLLVALADHPSIFCIEDSHWMDDASADLLSRLAASLDALPWVLVITRRPSGAPGPALPDGATRIDLAPLDPASTAELVEVATRDDPLPRHVIEGLAHRADGNPLFLLELLNAVRSGGDLESLPSSVEVLITARVDRLPAPDRNLLRRTAVLGSGFAPIHIGSVIDDLRDPDDVVRRLGDFLVADHDGWVRFRHALVRDVAYEGLPYRTRRDLHGRVADSMMANGGAAGDDVAVVSLHLFHARRDREALECSVRAGDRARDVYANLDAIALYGRALAAARRLGTVDVLAQAEILESLGDVQNLAGLYHDARSAYTAVRRLVGDDVDRQVGVLLKEAQVAERQGRLTDSVRAVRRGLRMLADRDGVDVETTRARLVLWEAVVRLAQGRYAEAADRGRQALDAAAALDDRPTLASALQVVDLAGVHTGRLDNTALSERALEIYDDHEDPQGEAKAANNLGVRYYYAGRWDEAAVLYERARVIRERIGDSVIAASCAMNLGELLVEQGDLGRAVELLGTARATCHSAGDSWGVAFTVRLLGIARVRSGRVDEGRTLLLEAQERFRDVGSRTDALDTNTALAEAALLEERPTPALQLLDELMADQRSRGGHEFQVPAIHRLRGIALAQLGDFDAGWVEIERAVDSARDLAADHELGLALDALIRFAASAGFPAPAAETAECREIFDRLRMRPRPSPVVRTAAGDPRRRTRSSRS